jgi:hypothetical protein
MLAEENRRKRSEAMKQYWAQLTPKQRARRAKMNRKYSKLGTKALQAIPSERRKEINEKIQASVRAHWASYSSDERRLRGSQIREGQQGSEKFLDSRSQCGMTTWKRRNARPTHLEKWVTTLACDLPIRYVGDGTWWLAGVNPDFKVTGQRKVVEVFDPEWPVRKDGWFEERKRYFRQRGYQCLIIPIRDWRRCSELAVRKLLTAFVAA